MVARPSGMGGLVCRGHCAFSVGFQSIRTHRCRPTGEGVAGVAALCGLRVRLRRSGLPRTAGRWLGRPLELRRRCLGASLCWGGMRGFRPHLQDFGKPLTPGAGPAVLINGPDLLLFALFYTAISDKDLEHVIICGGLLLPSALLTIAPVIALVGVIHLALFLLATRKKKKKRKAQMEAVALRGPGQSLLVRMDRVAGDIHGCYVYLLIIPLVILVVHLFLSYILNVPDSWLRVAVSAGIAFAYVCYFLWRLVVLGTRQKTHRSAYEGEVAVAKQLNRLMADGYHVYHDFPADRFYIDHIVIGPIGVIAVETMARTKASSRNREPEPVVTYDGRMLHFPKYSDYQIIEKAKHQAEWLSHWIADTAGEEIAARAIVALPGWSVKRTSADGIPVVNPGQIETLFKHMRPRPLLDNQVASIVRLIDQQCRDTGIDGNCCYTVSE